MKEYLDMVKYVLGHGNLTRNRTGVDTFTKFPYTYEVDLSKGFPLLTTKKMRTKSLIEEVLWYISGEEHIRNLKTKTKIWDAWADDDGNLESAYGRFWRRWPIHEQRLDSEALAGEFGSKNAELEKYIRIEMGPDGVHKTLDQLALVRDLILNDPESRRMIITAWNPANAFASILPPCHYTFAFGVEDNRLNCALIQRSGDIALGIPFNLAAYALMTNIMAVQTHLYNSNVQLIPGTFSHTIINAHIYCGEPERSRFYWDNKEKFQDRIRRVRYPEDLVDIKDWIEASAAKDSKLADHVPNLLLQASREPKRLATLIVAKKPFDDIKFEDIQILEYEHHEPIIFGVAV